MCAYVCVHMCAFENEVARSQHVTSSIPYIFWCISIGYISVCVPVCVWCGICDMYDVYYVYMFVNVVVHVLYHICGG